MKTYVLIFSFLVSIFSFSIQAAMPAQKTSTSPQSTNQPAVQKADGEIIEAVMVLNTNEINAAKEALKKASDPMVKKFARQMARDHSKNLFEFKSLSRKDKITPVAWNKSESLKTDGRDELDKLKAEDKKDFDKTYMDAMVKGHENALSLIDDSIKRATDPDLIKKLNATRATVQHHLDMAKATQKHLAQKS